MSRRRDRARREAGTAAQRAAARPEHPDTAARSWAPGRRPPRIPFVAQAGVLVAVFAVTTLIAELAGAANLGVSLGIGSITFSLALVAVIVKT